MPKMERVDESKRPSVEDLTFWVEEIYKNHKTGSIELSDWEKGFIVGMKQRLDEGMGFTESMEQKIQGIYEAHLE
jgi:hypothetical protein